MIQQKRNRKWVSQVAECVSRFLSHMTVFAGQGIDKWSYCDRCFILANYECGFPKHIWLIIFVRNLDEVGNSCGILKLTKCNESTLTDINIFTPR